jgi:hypothetical protein
MTGVTHGGCKKETLTVRQRWTDAGQSGHLGQLSGEHQGDHGTTARDFFCATLVWLITSSSR